MPAAVAKVNRAIVSACLVATITLVSVVPPARAGGGAVDGGPATAVAIVTATPAAMSRSVLVLINRDRTARGIPPLRADAGLSALASDRADWMARNGRMTHYSAGGDILRAVVARGLKPSMVGECVGWTNATPGRVAARWLFVNWKRSPSHWDLMMSPQFTLIGVGFGYRAATQETYASLILSRP